MSKSLNNNAQFHNHQQPHIFTNHQHNIILYVRYIFHSHTFLAHARYCRKNCLNCSRKVPIAIIEPPPGTHKVAQSICALSVDQHSHCVNNHGMYVSCNKPAIDSCTPLDITETDAGQTLAPV